MAHTALLNRLTEKLLHLLALGDIFQPNYRCGPVLGIQFNGPGPAKSLTQRPGQGDIENPVEEALILPG